MAQEIGQLTTPREMGTRDLMVWKLKNIFVQQNQASGLVSIDTASAF